MESQGLNLPLPSYIYSNTIKKLLREIKNPILKNMIKVWSDVKTLLHIVCLNLVHYGATIFFHQAGQMQHLSYGKPRD